jgi:FkbM family methyltransferase
MSGFRHWIRSALKILNIRYARKIINGHEYLLPLEGYSLRAMIGKSDATLNDPAEIDYLKCVLDIIQPGQTVFDVGVYRGYFSLAFLGKVGDTGQIIAFEPNPYNVRLLKQTITANHLSNVTIVPKAISDQPEGKLKMWVTGISSVSSLRDEALDTLSTETVDVDVTSIDHFVAETGIFPNAIKIDIEGAELLALQGATETLKQQKTIVACEIHPNKLPAFGHTAQQVEEFFVNLDYRAYPGEIFNEEKSASKMIQRAIYRPGKSL